MRGRATHECLRNARGDDDCVLRIEPVVRVAYAVGVASLVHDTLTAYLQQWNTRGGVHIGIATAHDALVADSSDERIQPVIVAKSDAHDEVGLSQLVEIARTRLECLRVDSGWHYRFRDDDVAANCGGECRKIRCRRHHANGRRSRSSGQQRRCNHQATKPGSHNRAYREATQVLLGTRQWTAFCDPTGAARRQSITMLARP